MLHFSCHVNRIVKLKKGTVTLLTVSTHSPTDLGSAVCSRVFSLPHLTWGRKVMNTVGLMSTTPNKQVG